MGPVPLRHAPRRDGTLLFNGATKKEPERAGAGPGSKSMFTIFVESFRPLAGAYLLFRNLQGKSGAVADCRYLEVIEPRGQIRRQRYGLVVDG